MHGPPWGDTEELLACTVEQLQVVSSLLHHAWFKPPHPEPVPIQRPGQGGNGQQQVGELAEPPRMSSKDEIRAFFGGPGAKVVVSDS